MTATEFVALLDRLAAALASGDHATAAECFAADVRYRDAMRMSIDGRDPLREALGAELIAPRIFWHQVMFDETRQVGAAEYTIQGLSRFHGIATMEVDGESIKRWHSLQHVSDFDWHEFWGTAGPARPFGE
ncbi:MAG: nuclear transport factor 2 family protein [Gemmatimonadetes bacterium]|nr:nuclear transport factor 2 family protein [Gemmatimonadota bacterium]